MRILTFNAGLLAFLNGRIEAASQLQPRLGAISEHLNAIDADLILLQEVYALKHRNRIASELQAGYPWSAYQQRPNWGRLDSSLMAFCRFPMSASLYVYKAAPKHERLFDRKGILVCRVDVDGFGPLTVFNTHTTAGGILSHPEDPRIELIRSRQIEELLRLARQQDTPVIVAGDMNAGPGVSEQNFESLRCTGFESVHDLLHEGAQDFSWEPSNRLNVAGPHRLCPPQRIDHILLRESDIASGRITPVTSNLCFNEEVVWGDDGKLYTVSDHFGLWADIQFRPELP